MERKNSIDIKYLIEFEIINIKEDKDKDNNESEMKIIIPESLTTNCFSCGNKFTSFLTRPYRCSICLKYFCNSCLFKLKIKLCKDCFYLCQQFNQIICKYLLKIIEGDITYFEMRETFYCKKFDDYQFSCKSILSVENNNNKNMENKDSNNNNNLDKEDQLLVNIEDKYDLIIKVFIKFVLKNNFKKEEIVNEWQNLLYILIKETISNLHPSSRYLNDGLDINKFIKIKIVPYKDNSLCQVIQGYVLDKKKKGFNIKDTIYNPRVLLLKKEINENDKNSNNKEDNNNKEEKNENLKDYEKYLLNFITHKINIIKPDIIIFGKEFPKEEIDFVKNIFNNISIIYDINNEVMIKLSRCFQSLILPSIKFIGKNNIIGSCKKFYTQNYTDNSNNNKDINNNNLFIFDGCNRLLFNTIILSGSDLDLLKKLKKLLRQILLPSIRDLFLQKYIQYILNMEISPIPQDSEMEADFIEKLYEESFISFNNQTNENILDNDLIFKNEKEKIEEKILKRNTSPKADIIHLFYEGFDLSIIENKENFDVYSLISLYSSHKNDLKINIKEEKDEEISEKAIHNMVNKYCADAKELYFSFFNGNDNFDKPLGKFILDLCKKCNIICPTCHLEYKKHTQYLFRSKGVLKLWMISEDENDLNKIIDYLKKETNIDYNKIIYYKNDSYSTYEIITSDIYTYGYCNICKGIVTPLFKISNEIFNYSSSKFIKFMLENHLSFNQKRNYNFNTSNIISQNKNNCEHRINKDICRIFVTRFGSWKFEYDDIKKYYITPMNYNLNFNSSFSSDVLFKKYETEGYFNSISTISLIQKVLLSQETFFVDILKDKKLDLFHKNITMAIKIIKAIHDFNDQCIMELINRHLKKNIKLYNNSYIRLISIIKKFYLNIVKIKFIINKIERLKINLKVISDILNIKIPITLEENNKLSESLGKEKDNNRDNNNEPDILKEEPLSEKNFGKDSSFQKMLFFLNHYDNNHDYYSCELNQDDLSSVIGTIISSNEYINFMELKSGINLTSIKNNKKKHDIIDNIIERNKLKIRKFSSYKQIQEKKNIFAEIELGIKRKMSLDENKDSSELFDTLLIFDQSNQKFYVEGDSEKMFTNIYIKKVLEEELNLGEKEHKTFFLNNELYSLLKKKKNSGSINNKKHPSNNNLSTKKLNCNNNDNNSDKTKNNYNNQNLITTGKSKYDNIKNDDDNGNSSSKSLGKFEQKKKEKKNSFKMSLESKINEIQKDHYKITEFLKEMEKLVNHTYKSFKINRESLNEIIKKQIENNSNSKKKNKKDKKESNKIINNNNVISLENNNDKKNENNEIKKNENREGNEVKKINNPEGNIPFFSGLPEFEKIAHSKYHSFFEEKFISNESNDIEVVIYYPKKFEALRISYCASFEDFLTSLSKSKEWTENTGGKSKASFYKTHDEKYILKSVSEYELNMFLDKGIEYFRYLSQFLFHKMPSALAKILGAYKIIIKQKNKEIKYNLILMENLYYGMMFPSTQTFNSPDSNIRVYDLKGSNVNRYIRKNMRKPGQVLLDTNFLVDFNRDPVFIDSNIYDRLKLALYNDTNYLKSLEVVDYSFLIIFNEKEKEKKEKKNDVKELNNYNDNNSGESKGDNYRLIKFGIIDYMRKYTWDKKMEFYGKSIIYGENPTIVDPNIYSERFYKRISRYFVGV